MYYNPLFVWQQGFYLFLGAGILFAVYSSCVPIFLLFRTMSKENRFGIGFQILLLTPFAPIAVPIRYDQNLLKFDISLRSSDTFSKFYLHINIIFPYSFLCSLYDKHLLTFANKAYNIERATEAPITFIIHLVVLFSGVIKQDKSTNIFLLSQRSFAFPHCKYFWKQTTMLY